MCDQLDPPKKLGLNSLNPRNDVKNQILNLGEKKQMFLQGGGGGPNTSTVLKALTSEKSSKKKSPETSVKRREVLWSLLRYHSVGLLAGVFGMGWNRLECQQVVMYIIYFYLLLLKSLNYATKRETLIDTKKDISIIYSYTELMEWVAAWLGLTACSPFGLGVLP